MAEMVFLGLIAVGILFLGYIFITPTNSSKPEPKRPPEGYAIDFLLKSKDLREGVSKAEIKRRERTGYYWIKIHPNGEIADREHWGKPKF